MDYKFDYVVPYYMNHRLPKFLYHVSCSDNRQSIATNGLLPYRYTGFNEAPGPICLAFQEPTDIADMIDVPSSNLLNDYLLLSSSGGVYLV